MGTNEIIRRRALQSGGSAVDWESIGRGLVDYTTPFEIPEGAGLDLSKGAVCQYHTNLTSAVIPEGVTSSVAGVFSGCTGLLSVTLPSTMTTLGNDMFFDCRNLASLNIPSGVAVIPQNLCYNCYALTSITLPSSITTINQQAFLAVGLRGSLVLPDAVTTIGSYAFRGVQLTSITFGANVTSIGTGVLIYSYNNLAEVIVNATTPPTAGANMFQGCNKLTAIYVPDASVSAYKSATNWSTYSSLIKGISERPAGGVVKRFIISYVCGFSAERRAA